MDNPLLVILGPTASGKTKLAVTLAKEFDGEIISADSRQVFKGMDIGTGKDLQEYISDDKVIPYHLINIKEAGEKYNVHEFKEDFYKVYEHIRSKNKLPILCGGTGMYIHSLLQEQPYTSVPVNEDLRKHLVELNIDELRNKISLYPAELTAKADHSSHKRLIRAIEIAEYLTFSPLPVSHSLKLNARVLGLTSELSLRRDRISDRLDSRLQQGLVEEVQQLITKGIPKEILSYYGLEYKFVVSYLNNETSYDEFKDRLKVAIFQYAKRQMTFFRKMEKDGIQINWFDSHTAINAVKNHIADWIRENPLSK